MKTEFDDCWNCGKSLGFKLTSCCGGNQCGCMGWPVQYPFCDLECHKQWQEKRDEAKRIDALTPLALGDDLPF